MKIYTKTGDVGETALFGGRRLAKHDLRIEAYGTVDELNSWVGLLRDVLENESSKNWLTLIQERLFTLGSMLAADPCNPKLKLLDITEADVEQLEQAIDEMDEHLVELQYFILPGGHQYVSYCHIARTVSRRAERLVVALHHEEPVDAIVLKYLNRLSDFLFTLARKTAHDLKVEEIAWKGRK